MNDKSDSPANDFAVPLVEETLEENVVPVERGKVRIHKRVITEPVEHTVELHQGEVTVERQARNEVVAERVQPWQEDGALMIPVYEEEVVTEIRLVLREVVRVKQVSRNEQMELKADVRREVIEVERADE